MSLDNHGALGEQIREALVSEAREPTGYERELDRLREAFGVGGDARETGNVALRRGERLLAWCRRQGRDTSVTRLGECMTERAEGPRRSDGAFRDYLRERGLLREGEDVDEQVRAFVTESLRS